MDHTIKNPDVLYKKAIELKDKDINWYFAYIIQSANYGGKDAIKFLYSKYKKIMHAQ